MPFKISNQVNVLGSFIHTAYVIGFLFQMSVGSDSDLNENDKDPYKQLYRKMKLTYVRKF